MFEVTLNEFTILCHPTTLPELYEEYRKRAALHEEFDLEERDNGRRCFVGVRKESGWPFLTIAQTHSPAGYGFNPGVLLVPETSTLFIGAGERLLAYDLREPKRLWTDWANVGFWHWKRHGNVVLMSAEIEFAAWTLEGVKLWTTFVEPPWHFALHGDLVTLDVMGKKTSFSVLRGPERMHDK